MTRIVSARAIAVAITLFCVPAWAQTPPAAVAPQNALETIQKVAEDKEFQAENKAMGSPRATMQTFLKSIGQLWENPTQGWSQAIETLDLPPDQTSEGHNYARKLYGVLNRIGNVNLNDLPDEEDVRAKKLTSYRYFPDRRRQHHVLNELKQPPAGGISLKQDENGLWHFDRDTMKQLPELFKQMEPLPQVAGKTLLTVSDYVVENLPRSLTESTFLTLEYWKWIAIAILIFAGLVVDLFVRLGLRRIQWRTESETERIEARRRLRPIGQLGALSVWWIAVQFLEIEGMAGQLLSGVLTVLLAIVGTLSAWRLTDLVGQYLYDRARATEGSIDDVLVPLVVRAFKIFIIVMAIVFAANALNLPLTPLLASITIAGVAFSFAAKDTVENFFGSVAVLMDRPFNMGDWVVIDSTEGMVELIGFRSTRVRTFYNSLVTIPNANLVRAVVDNYGRRRYRRWKTTLGVQYNTTPDQLISFTEGIRELIRLHPYTRKDYYEVYCNDFGESSLNILLYLFFEVPDWNTELRERERMFLDIVRLADSLGVQFAFPTQTVHLFEGQTPGEPTHENPGRQTERDRTLLGAQAAQQIVAEQPWLQEKPPPVKITTHRTEAELDDAGNIVTKETEEQ